MLFTREEAQYAFQKQTAFGAVPGAPDMITLPRDGSFNITHGRNKIENPQVFADGRKRKFALGNHTTAGQGSLVPNMAFIGHILRAFCGAPATSGVGAPYTHVFKPTSGALAYYLFEKGITAQALWRRYLDLVAQSLSLDLPIEGICTVGTNWVGSGTMTQEAAAFDVTPTDIAGNPSEYADIVLQEDGINTEDVLNVTLNLEKNIVEKRVHNGGGKATALRCGAITGSGTIQSFFTSEARANKALNKTLAAIKATLSNGADSLEILGAEAQLEPADWVAEEDGIKVTHNFDLVYAASADAPAKFTLINSVASYA